LWVRSPGPPYLKALRWARPKINTAQKASLRIGDRLILSRPSAPEGVAQGRATIRPGRARGRSGRSRFPSFWTAGRRVPVSSEPSRRRQHGRMVSRRNVAINGRAARAHGVSRAGPSGDDAGRAAGARDRLPLGQAPIAGRGPVARAGPDRFRVALPLLEARSAATDVPMRPDLALEAAGTRRFAACQGSPIESHSGSAIVSQQSR
jgi:hypothetical protein